MLEDNAFLTETLHFFREEATGLKTVFDFLNCHTAALDHRLCGGLPHRWFS
jgi:hypothetical protein